MRLRSLSSPQSFRAGVWCAVYLFGSRETGKADELSDIDIALFVEGKRVPFDAELDLLGEITSTLQTDDVSLVVLNNAPLTIADGIIRKAKCFSAAMNTHAPILKGS
ncbi:MAG: nucleotidyltransferase domain-containing protein [Nitrospirota bacterium]|nr:nucleotidyltransferase domain-containing protein [Nitrospirota bacterium]